jgi:AcrR family transcriptional regulator
MTLYAPFPSKDDLIVAYLERANEQFWEWWEGAGAGVDDPRRKLVAMFEAVEKLADSPQCLGCTFQGTAAEFPDPEHPGHRVAIAHKQAVRARLRTLAELAELRDPGDLADQLLLLMDGAWVAARMFGPDNPAAHVAGGELLAPWNAGAFVAMLACWRSSPSWTASPCSPSPPRWAGVLPPRASSQPPVTGEIRSRPRLATVLSVEGLRPRDELRHVSVYEPADASFERLWATHDVAVRRAD